MPVRALTAAGLIVVAVSVTACSKAATSSAGSAPASSAQASATTTANPAATQTGGGGGGGAGAVDVCSLMTSAQASSINSVTYGATTPKHVEGGYDNCVYKNTGKHASPADIQDLTVTVISLPGCYEQLKSAEGPGKKVTGVGDDAFGYGIGIVVKTGDRCLEVQGLTVAELGNDYGPDAAMAKIIIGRLG